MGHAISSPKTEAMFPVVAAISIPASVAVGSAIADPRSITGAWEQESGLGKAVGFDVEISTDAEGASKSLAGITQRVVVVWITTYVRTNGRSQRTFWSTNYGEQFSWQKDHLILHHRPSAAGNANSVDLDVVFDPRKQAWLGTLQNEWFSGSVELTRPFVSRVGFPIVGDWIWGNGRNGYIACLHVGLGRDSTLVIWSDHISFPGFIYGQNGSPPPLSTREWYGSLGMDPEMKNIGSNILFFTGTAMSGDVVLGNVSADSTTFSGSAAHFGNGVSNGAFNPFAWRRSTSDCASGS
jgi:hypothetical protein